MEKNAVGQKVLRLSYQGGRNPRVEAQEAHVGFHAAVHHQVVLPTGLPDQLTVDWGQRKVFVCESRRSQTAEAPALLQSFLPTLLLILL